MIWLIVPFLVLYFVYELYWKRRNLPPGPTPLPIVGNLHTLLRHEPGYSAFEMWRRQYGPVCTFWLGSFPFVLISDYPTLKETFVRDGNAFAGKFHVEEITKLYRGGQYGIVDTVGEMWREHRRFALHVLRDFGLGKDGMEQRVLLEVEAMTKTLQSEQGTEVNLQDAFDVAVGSVINQLLFGYRFDEEHVEEFRQLKTLISRQMRDFAHPAASMLMVYPWLKYLPYFSSMYAKLLSYRDAFYSFFDKQIEAHGKHVNYDSDESNDYVEAYLKEKKRREADGDEVSFSHIQLQNVCLDLWFAGMETTSNTLSWGAVFLLNHLDVQTKMQEEFDREIGSTRLITMADKNRLPYTNAVINEIQRMANLLPMNLPHETMRDVRVGEWNLPGKTGVIPQISTVLYDKEIFPDPLNFNPSRFIDDAGKLKKVDELIPFSIGKRQCLGEGLAKMELFLFIANLFNRFEISCVDPSSPPTMKKTFGTTVQPLDYRCYVKCRAS
ncbi:unspecific monooxygenase [Ancylostoma caninum]|uniref:Unspecific monooxygenase n=1 Tax=Ancylostoma caninum TaxID=29170 RepID=A0A368GAI5_ANCCA|nr:unspecific monooxygenase [Ancylostoma caninum]